MNTTTWIIHLKLQRYEGKRKLKFITDKIQIEIKWKISFLQKKRGCFKSDWDLNHKEKFNLNTKERKTISFEVMKKIEEITKKGAIITLQNIFIYS